MLSLPSSEWDGVVHTSLNHREAAISNNPRDLVISLKMTGFSLVSSFPK